MSTNSSQSSAFLLIGVIVAGVLYGLFNLSTDLEQNTLSGNFNKSTKNIYKNDVKEIAMTEFGKPAATRSDLSGVSMPSYKKSANADAGYSQESSVDFPSAAVSTVDVQNLSRKTTRTAINSNITYQTNVLQSNSVIVGNTSNGTIISAQKAPTQSDIDAMFMFNAQSKEVGSNQGTIRATGALAAKTAAASTSLTGKKGVKKVGGLNDDPGEPGDGGGGPSLPIGDGVWVLLMFAGVYLTVKRF
jgi:hypothetical protein